MVYSNWAVAMETIASINREYLEYINDDDTLLPFKINGLLDKAV